MATRLQPEQLIPIRPSTVLANTGTRILETFRSLRMNQSSAVRNRAALVASFVALSLSQIETARADNQSREALYSTYANGQLARVIVAYCTAHRVPSAGQLLAAYQAWRARARFDDVVKQVAPSPTEQTALLAAFREKVHAEMQKNASRFCAEAIPVFQHWNLDPQVPAERDRRSAVPDMSRPSSGRSTLSPQSVATPASTNAQSVPSVMPSMIHTVVTTTEYGFGAGGFSRPYYTPVVLFKDGWACADMSVLAPGMDLARHRAVHSNKWSRWRSANGRGGWQYERRTNSGNWEGFDMTEYPPFRSGARLNGSFTRISGGGNTAIGGNTIAIAVKGYTFRSDGTFSRSGTMGVSSHNAAARGGSGIESGTYRIDGYLLTTRLQNGQAETHSIVGAEGNASLLYIDGLDYSPGS